MSKDNFFDAVQPYILEEGDTLSKDEIKKYANKTDEIGQEYAEDCEFVFDEIPNFGIDGDYYMTAGKYNIIAETDALIEFHRDREDVVYIPEFLKDNELLLKDIYRGVTLDGEVYRQDHPDITQARDTGNFIFKSDGYNIKGRGWQETRDGIVQLGDTRYWAREEDTVMTEDMGYRWYRRDCYEYHNDQNEVEYYRYRNLAPNAGRRLIRFDEVDFPDPDDINEMRVGVELEYRSAVDASVAVVKDDHMRSLWSSVHDGSIVPDDVPRDQEKATEFVSAPMPIEKARREITRMMDVCQVNGARAHKSCGFHVHVGKPNLDFHDLTSLVVLCENIESSLFRLMPDHRQNNEYCKKLDGSFGGFRAYEKGNIETEEEVAETFYEGQATAKTRSRQGKWSVGDKRHYWLSVDRYWYCKDEPHKRTVEFRMHHATHEIDDFVQFVVLCYHIAQFAFNNSAEKCLDATLQDVVDNIYNRQHKEMVSHLLQSKKVITKR